MSRVPVLAALCAALVLVPSAAAKPPAPGAPGDRHTWAPADKHGFPTAHQRGGNAYADAAPGVAERGLLPRSLHARLPRAAVRRPRRADAPRARPSTTTRPTSSRSRAACTARVEPLPGALGFRQVVSAPGWRLTKTWITDPGAADRARGRAARVALRPQAPALRARRPGAGRRRRRRPRVLAAGSWSRGTTTRPPPWPRRPRLAARDERLRRHAQRPVAAARARRGPAAATTPASAATWSRARGRALDGVRHQSMTLAIGFGAARARARRGAPPPSLRAGFAPALARFTAGWRGYLASLPAPPAPVAGDAALTRLYEQSLMVLAASEDKLYRGASIASPSMPWVWGTLTLDGRVVLRPVPPRLAARLLPRGHRAEGGRRRRGRDPAASTTCGAVQKADGSWWQNTRVNGEKYWTTLQLDEVALPGRARLVARAARRRRLAPRRAAADFIALKGPKTAAGALGEPERLVAEHDRHRDRRR